ncbi:MAG: globin domain-containing protein [Pseudomonadota bacterium]
MHLSQEQIDLIRKSFADMMPMDPAVPGHLYARLFELAPEARGLFHAGVDRQGAMFMEALGVIVGGLYDIETLQEMVRTLAHRHVAYGVKAEYYPHLCQALVDTLAHALGDRFDAETRAAWSAAITLISTTMLVAAYPDDHTDADLSWAS